MSRLAKLRQPAAARRCGRSLTDLKQRAALSQGIYSLDRIVQAAGTGDDPAMDLARVSQPSQRPADNELYVRSRDLVAATMAIRRIAGETGSHGHGPA